MSMEGIIFPENAAGQRSSSDAGKAALAAALRGGGAGEDAAGACANERQWRFGYKKHFAEHVRNALDTPENAVNAATAGLAHLHNEFRFVRGDKECSLAEALDGRFDGATDFHTGVIEGGARAAAAPGDFHLRLPYKNDVLEGDKLKQQVRAWEEYGTIESSCSAALQEVVDAGPKWCDLRDKYFVILGALSAMGPYEQLMDAGANVIALDLDRAGIWQRLIEKARNSPGRLIFPMKRPQAECKSDEELFENAGCNLITHAPDIASWVAGLEPGKELTVGCYVYLDGEAHVRVALACDMVMQVLVERRKANVAFLCTPTDMHVIPKEANDAAKQNYSLSNLANIPLIPVRALGGKKMLVYNAPKPLVTDSGDEFYYVDGLVVPQGPNYALAKRMQHWRAIVSREVGQVIASSNVAPSTATRSVISNKQFAWAYDGMPYFKPFEIFGQETSNGVMTALLLHDLFHKESAANPKTPLKNPYELQSFNGFHGGVWRAGYTVGSIGEVSVLIHFMKVLKPFFILAALAIVAYKYLM